MEPILDQLYTVQSHRADKTMRDMLLKKSLLAQAQNLKHKKEQALTAYQAYRQNEEQRIFDALQTNATNVFALMAFADTVRSLRDHQDALARDVAEVSAQVSRAQAELTDAQRCFAEACRKKEKIEIQREMEMGEDRKARELKEEQENGDGHCSNPIGDRFPNVSGSSDMTLKEALGHR